MNRKRIRQMNTALLRRLTGRPTAEYFSGQPLLERLESENYIQRFAPLYDGTRLRCGDVLELCRPELAELSGGEPEGGGLRFAYDFARRQLFPAGRLDKTSTGFVLLTDDGTFAHDILAPKRHVSKTYTVVIDTPLTEEMRRGFAEGVTLADGTALSPAEVEALTPDGLTVKVRLRQGVYHQIKRMFGVYGAGVNALHRDAIGGLALDPALAPGQWRELSAEEVSKISS